LAGPAQRDANVLETLASLKERLGRSPRVLMVVAPYYQDIADLLEAGARAELSAAGADIDTVTATGALEIPQALEIVLNAPGGFDIDGAIAIGCVIRGETSHYEIVCNNTNHWLMDVALRHSVPLGNAVLTVDTHDQAVARAQGGASGKGGDAARAVLSLIALMAERGQVDSAFTAGTEA